MTDRSTSRPIDEVPEADLAEQSIPAYPNDPTYPDDTPDRDGAIDQEIAENADRDVWSADPADVLEQAIPVPLDDEPDPA
ncbi:hypothetical protein [Nocardia iowensis]|uniref:Uncharacterized protein n=1 Tax=Nocardia iowensis TaxID=204891 RepID=A0ABX8RRT5_NOCIO|nr:hypothetical protein [Nocardia iowensis]QXN91040.1 hypothetical protein KV110_37795 [Nocardia iowensis]